MTTSGFPKSTYRTSTVVSKGFRNFPTSRGIEFYSSFCFSSRQFSNLFFELLWVLFFELLWLLFFEIVLGVVFRIVEFVCCGCCCRRRCLYQNSCFFSCCFPNCCKIRIFDVVIFTIRIVVENEKSKFQFHPIMSILLLSVTHQC